MLRLSGIARLDENIYTLSAALCSSLYSILNGELKGMICEICVGLNFPTFNKVILEVLGLELGQPRSPLVPYSESVKEAVEKDLQAMGFFEWSK